MPFLPASNLFLTVGFVIAERTLLLPSVGYCLLIILGYSNMQKSLKLRKYVIIYLRDALYNLQLNYSFQLFFGFTLLLFTYSIRTIERNTDWISEKKLFLSALDVCSLNAKVHYNIGKIAADEKNKALAIEKYRKAIELNPHYEQAMNNLANILREDKNFEEAEVLLRNAVQIRFYLKIIQYLFLIVFILQTKFCSGLDEFGYCAYKFK